MKIQFCDLCNESVPQADLDHGRAVLRSGRVICARCEGAMSGTPVQSQHAAGERPAAEASIAEVRVGEETTIMEAAMAPALPRTAPRGSTGAAVGVAMASIALIFSTGAAAFLFDQLQVRGRALEALVREERTAREYASSTLEDRMGQTLRDATAGLSDARLALAELSGRMETIGSGQRESSSLLRDDMERLRRQMDEVDRLVVRVGRHEEEIARVAETTAGLHDDVLRMADRMSEVEEADESPAVETPRPEVAREPAWTPLLADLTSQNSGKRWQAVQSLGGTRDPAVAEHLTPMLRDPDIFVRMATARILGDLDAAVGIPSLIDALEDAEASVREAAVVSLRSITGRDFKFDPGAKDVERAKRVKAWRDWWKRSSEEVLGRS